MSWLTDARFRRISYALVLGWILGLSLFLLLGSDSFSAFYPGDLPGFYVPGVIFDRGLFSELYNFDLQRSLENEFWPTAHNAYYAFAYPPYTAVLLWPLAWLTPITAKIVWTIIQLFACGGTLFFLSRLCSFSPQTRFAIYVLLLSCAPIMTSLMGAQNTCFSAFLFAGTLYFLNVDTPRGHSLAGLFAGALLYKPQFGLILIAYLLALRNWRAASGAGFMGFLFYLLGASVQGWNWPQLWLNHANSFGLQNYVVNGHQMVSLHGILFTVSQIFTNTPSHLSLVLWICTLMSFFLIAWVLLRCFQKKRSIRASFPYVALIAVVLSPQTLFYDFGIPLFFLPLLGNNDSKRVLLQALMVSWICESLRFVETVPAYAPLVLWYGYLLRDFASCKRS